MGGLGRPSPASRPSPVSCRYSQPTRTPRAHHERPPPSPLVADAALSEAARTSHSAGTLRLKRAVKPGQRVTPPACGVSVMPTQSACCLGFNRRVAESFVVTSAHQTCGADHCPPLARLRGPVLGLPEQVPPAEEAITEPRPLAG